MLWRQHQTHLYPALLCILFVQEEHPICLTELSHVDAHQTCNNDKNAVCHSFLGIGPFDFIWQSGFYKYFMPSLLIAKDIARVFITGKSPSLVISIQVIKWSISESGLNILSYNGLNLPHVPGEGEGGTPYSGLYGEAPPERGTFFGLQV